MPPQTYPAQFNQQTGNPGYQQNQANAQNYANIYGNPYPNQNYSQSSPMDIRPVTNMNNQNTVQQTYILGRVINEEKDVVAGEVPNDGTYGTYIQSDFKRIYMKTWGGNGLIDTRVYELVEPGAPVADPNQIDPMQMILQRLDNIEKMVKNNRPFNNKSNYKKQPKQEQKGGEVNE